MTKMKMIAQLVRKLFIKSNVAKNNEMCALL